jgi:WD40 repeat protein
MAFTPDSRYILAGTDDGLLRIWDVATWRILDTIKAHDGSIRAIAFSPDGKLMATASHDWSVKIWDAPQ